MISSIRGLQNSVNTKSSQVELRSGFTNFNNEINQINLSLNSASTETSNLLSLKANQSDMISGFAHLTSTTSTISNNFLFLYNNTINKFIISLSR